MTDSGVSGQPPGATARSLGERGGGLARAALSIALVTVVARVVGFGRVGVLAQTVGTSCLGDVYATANLVPNIVFEVVAGGALASLVVPVLAAAVEAGDTARANHTTSALLTWTVVLLLPLAVLGALLAGPIMSALVGAAKGGCNRAAEVRVGASMLVVFMPQVVLYGVAIVLTGVLQAHRRFLGPALAPLLSSVVVIAAYLAFAAQARGDVDLDTLPRARELTLAVGTTLGVVVLSLSQLLPLRRTALTLRPRLSFPPGVARTARRLAFAGAAGLLAQQLSVIVVLRLANEGTAGSVVVYQLANAVFLLPWAVLAVPIATSAFPTLSARASLADERGYAETAAATLRAVVLVTLAAAAVLVVTAAPTARVLVSRAQGVPSVHALTQALIGFAPGLVGYGLLALLARALYARGDARSPTVATVAGWLVAAGADVVLARLFPVDDRVVALAVGNSIGMSVAGVLLLRALHATTAGGATAGLSRAAVAGAAAAAAAVFTGGRVAAAVADGGVLTSVAQAAAAAAASVAVFAVVTLVLDREDIRRLLPGWSAGG